MILRGLIEISWIPSIYKWQVQENNYIEAISKGTVIADIKKKLEISFKKKVEPRDVFRYDFFEFIFSFFSV